MTDKQIQHMVNRFLSWKLPENFNPDAGISFKRTFNEHTSHPMKHEPIGTNLFDATQAEMMVRDMVHGLAEEMERDKREREDITASKVFVFASRFKEEKQWHVIGGFVEQLAAAWWNSRKAAPPKTKNGH